MSERIFTVHPENDDDIEAAAIAQKLVDSPAFLESHRKAMRLGARRLAEAMAAGVPLTAEELRGLVLEDLKRSRG